MHEVYFVSRKVEYVYIKCDFHFLSRNKFFKYLRSKYQKKFEIFIIINIQKNNDIILAIKDFLNDNSVIFTINIVDAIIEFIVKSNHDIKSRYNFRN